MTSKEVFAALAAPFDQSEIKTRKGPRGDFRYITARTARARLNEVLGPENWGCEITPGDKWVKCSLTIFVDQHPITREALGGYPDMPTEEDRVKGGDSDAFKRACVTFGVGEHLYGDEAPHEPYKPPVASPDPYPPKKEQVGQWFDRGNSGASAVNREYSGGAPGWPKTGGAFYAWVMNIKDKYKWPSVVNEVIENFVKSPDFGFPQKFKEWDSSQVEEVACWVAEGCAKDTSIYRGEFDEHIGAKK